MCYKNTSHYLSWPTCCVFKFLHRTWSPASAAVNINSCGFILLLLQLCVPVWLVVSWWFSLHTFCLAASLMASTCSFLLRFIIAPLNSGLVVFPIRFHKLSIVVSTHFVLGFPILLYTPGLIWKCTGVIVSGWKIKDFIGSPSSAGMILFKYYISSNIS